MSSSARLDAVREDRPGAKWRRAFRTLWPAYRQWYRRRTDTPPSPETCRARLREHMPELLSTFDSLVSLAGTDDETVTFLSSYRPPPYVAACSQLVFEAGEPLLVRNYDYSPALWEGLLLGSAWNGRRVIAMSDCMWGALDGLNEDGLAVALAFGGRRAVGDGFGCPLLLRYLLETCRDTADARRALRRLPSHMAYNVTVLDAGGNYLTARIGPGRPPRIGRTPLVTNHQASGDWPEYVRASASRQRERCLRDLLREFAGDGRELIQRFLEPPLLRTGYDRAMGTLYTAIYRPASRRLELRWPGGVRMRQSIDAFEETSQPLQYAGGTGAAPVRRATPS